VKIRVIVFTHIIIRAISSSPFLNFIKYDIYIYIYKGVICIKRKNYTKIQEAYLKKYKDPLPIVYRPHAIGTKQIKEKIKRFKTQTT
jgi:hypothetical protein